MLYEVLADLGVQILLAVAIIVLGAMIPFVRPAIDAFVRRSGVIVDEQRAAALERALINGIEESRRRLGNADPKEVENYLRTFNPQTLAHFGLDAARDLLRRRIEAAISTYTVAPEDEQPISSTLPGGLPGGGM